MAAKDAPIEPVAPNVMEFANLLMERHGDRGVIVATNRARTLGERGDREGALRWLEISKLVLELKRLARDK